MTDIPLATATEDKKPLEYISDVEFSDLQLSASLLRALTERGYLHPTPVQAQAFGPARAGKDLIVRSKTGTGKTTAFGLPLLEMIADGERSVKALILCPTRELALQVAAEIETLAKYKNVGVATIYGGASIKAQEDSLKAGAAIAVGTPGRVYDLIQRGTLNLAGCNHVVLDEADEMLNQGFFEEVNRILGCLPEDKQVLLFSATLPTDIQGLIARHMETPETLLLSGDVLTVDHIQHVCYEVSDAYPKPRNLIYILEMEAPKNAIIFCNTKDDTQLVTAVLNRNGFDSELLNGDLAQKERERVMGKVKRGEVAFMVATDIAARGIDISDLGHVINYSLPEDPAVYLHRVGRTGRIGNKGVAINLTSGREFSTFSTLEKQYHIQFEKRPMPSPEVATKMWTDRHLKEIRNAAASSVHEGFLPLAAQLKGHPDSDEYISFLLKYFFSHLRVEKVRHIEEVKPSSARPSSSASASSGPVPRKTETPSHAYPKADRFWVNAGTQDGYTEEALKAALDELGSPGILKWDFRPTYSYVWAPPEHSGSIEALQGKLLGQKALKIEKARPPGKPVRRKAPRSSGA